MGGLEEHPLINIQEKYHGGGGQLSSSTSPGNSEVASPCPTRDTFRGRQQQVFSCYYSNRALKVRPKIIPRYHQVSPSLIPGVSPSSYKMNIQSTLLFLLFWKHRLWYSQQPD